MKIQLTVELENNQRYKIIAKDNTNSAVPLNTEEQDSLFVSLISEMTQEVRAKLFCRSESGD